MIPLFVKGKSIAETWEKALVELWNNGISMPTEYDVDPHTGFKHPPSKDCMMTMIVENALAEPRLHCCLEGGPLELAEYKLEVVDGIKDHWVKLSPEDTKWTYTYHNRLFNWGSQLNFASLPGEGSIDINNPWTQLAYVRKVDQNVYVNTGESVDGSNGLKYEIIPPTNQIQHIIDTLVEAPYSRRAVALTGFPAGDKDTHDPPCLRYIQCRGYYSDCLTIDMHTHWRSRDGFGAALFNMYALTELQRYIVDEIQIGLHKKFDGEYPNFDINKINTQVRCSICNEILVVDDGFLSAYPHASNMLSCPICHIRPYKVKAGKYIDVADSFHIYGHKLKEFEDRFINSALNQPYERRFWDLSSPEMQEMLKEGEEKAYKLVKSLDGKNSEWKISPVNLSI